MLMDGYDLKDAALTRRICEHPSRNLPPAVIVPVQRLQKNYNRSYNHEACGTRQPQVTGPACKGSVKCNPAVVPAQPATEYSK